MREGRRARDMMETVETDVLIIGSGAGGLTAALVVAAAGQRALIVEKAQQWGGASATSGGMIWIPASAHALARGASDSAEEAFDYIRACADPNIPDANVRAFVLTAPRMLAWLEANTHVRYRSIPYTDYRQEVRGAKLGYRTHDPVPLDGAFLGPSLERLRPSAPAALLFNRIAFTMDDVHPLLHRTPGWRRVLLRLLARYYLDIGQRLKSPRNRFLAAGNALVGRLGLSVNERNVPFWLDAPVVELIRGGDRPGVTGAIVSRAGGRTRINTSRAVILATGGFERNAEMRRKYLPGSWNPDWSGSIESNTGDGIRLAESVGASVLNMDSAWWGPMLKLPDESRSRLLTFERALPGCIIVNQAGRRYMNEACAYDIAGRIMVDADRPGAGTTPSYFLFDQGFRDRYPVGPLLPGVPRWLHQKGVRQILVKARTWEVLAARSSLPATTLGATIERFNADATRGRDREFARGDSAYDRYYGDPKVTPNPNLGPLQRPPFYAMPIYPGDIGTNGGLATNEHAQVLDEKHDPIPGLYAVGNTAASVMGHSYPGAGGTIGPAMTFGFIAAQHSITKDPY
jgi:3-oxosteroid 1-dehydrogenase